MPSLRFAGFALAGFLFFQVPSGQEDARRPHLQGLVGEKDAHPRFPVRFGTRSFFRGAATPFRGG
jgi:hypothetical protein